MTPARSTKFAEPNSPGYVCEAKSVSEALQLLGAMYIWNI